MLIYSSVLHGVCMVGPIPDSIGQLQNLTLLDIYGTESFTCNASKPVEIPDSITGLRELVELRIVLPTLAGTIPKDFGRLSLLQTLHLEVNKLNLEIASIHSEVPASFRNLSNLKTLRFIETELATFSDLTDVSFPNLTEISLAGSRDFHGDLTGLVISSSKLQIIDFSFTSISLDFGVFTRLPELTSLRLDNTHLRESISRLFAANLPNLTYLSLRNCGTRGQLTTINHTKLKSLKYLDLSGNLLSGSISRELSLLPLETLSIYNTLALLFPDDLGPLNATLVHLDLRGLLSAGGTLPASLGAFHKLQHLSLKCDLSGTIPAGLGLAPNLKSVYLSDNTLTGTIPDFWTTEKDFVFDLHDNQLTGSIPASLAARATALLLHNNQLSGEIASDLFSSNANLGEITLGHNHFSGPLPLFHNNTPSFIDLSFNSFSGEIPASYGSAKELNLASNQLAGSLRTLLLSSCSSLVSLYLDHNKFTGSFPNPVNCFNLTMLSISNNEFLGQIPTLPDNIRLFDASHNHFNDFRLRSWITTPAFRSLQMLDLSGNSKGWPGQFTTPVTRLIGPNMVYFAAAGNSFVAFSDVLPENPFSALRTLDLTNCQLQGTFPAELFPNLNVLKIASNVFVGELDLRWFSSISQLDISDNGFSFEASQFSSIPSLANVDASRNHIHGSLTLSGLPNLQTFDLSRNMLNLQPDLAAIGLLFADYSLKLLDISNNSLPTFTEIDTKGTGLARTTVSSPSVDFSDSVTCYDLSFFGKGAGSFIYDESIFSYLQCDCNQAHFGTPPLRCFSCDTDRSQSCNGLTASILNNSYAFFINTTDLQVLNPATGPSQLPEMLSNLVALLWPHATNSEPESLLEGAESISDADLSSISLMHESCLVTPVQILSSRSNCKGVTVNATDIDRVNGSVANVLNHQCEEGSEGRLCSKCSCSDAECWFPRGFHCSKCRRIFSPTSSILFLLGMIFLLIIALGIISVLVIRRKRVQSLQPFNQLSLLKRCFYRLLYLKSLGTVSILITFLQMLIEFTQWDAYANVEFLQIINGGGQGYESAFAHFLIHQFPCITHRH